MSNYKGVLFLEGVFKEDVIKIEDMFEERMFLEETVIDIKNYDKIPSEFTGVESWPKKTNLLCNYCTLNIKSFPWFEPRSLDIIDDKIQSMTEGVYCSPNCVVAHINLKYHDIANCINKIEMLKIIYNWVVKEEIDDITPSPNYLLMQKFGGDMTEDDFIKSISNKN